jgi:8-oxo-dGTP diphosphatase
MKPRAAVILIQNDKIALIERYRSNRHYFAFPGGKIEQGETAAVAAGREALEELGLQVEIGHMVAEVWYLGAPQYYFLAKATGGQFGRGTGHEMSSQAGTEKGTHLPVWMALKDIITQPVLPKLLAEYVQNCSHASWPEQPLVVREQPPDPAG